ncbi:hypothetical protein HY256_08140 [Candidatus Sumerlaeota bacterium]|nr:hypothetical protein [Candidatus Sumerlaeota bacterium]
MAADSEHLTDDFIGGALALKSSVAGQTEGAADGATNLRGETEAGSSLAFVAHDDALDDLAVAQAPNNFPGSGLAPLGLEQFDAAERDPRDEIVFQLFGEIFHLLPTFGAMLVDPVVKLLCAKGRIPPRLQ